MHNARPYFSHRAVYRPFSVVLGAILLPGSIFGSSPEALPDPLAPRSVARPAEQSSGAFLVELQSGFSQAAPETLPQHVTAAIRLRPELAARIAAAAVRVIASAGAPAEASRCASVEQVISAAINLQREAALAITRKTVAAAPGFRDCIVSAATQTAQAADSRLAFLRAARQGELVRALVARTIDSNAEMTAGGRGTINPANVSGGSEDTQRVRSPEQPPNNNPPNNNPPNNNPPNNPPPNNPPPPGRPPHGNRPPHNQPPNVP